MTCHHSTKLIIERLGPLSVTVAEWLTRSSTDLKVVGSSLLHGPRFLQYVFFSGLNAFTFVLFLFL